MSPNVDNLGTFFRIYILERRSGTSEEFGTHLGLLSSCRIQPTLYIFWNRFQINIWSTNRLILSCLLSPLCLSLSPAPLTIALINLLISTIYHAICRYVSCSMFMIDVVSWQTSTSSTASPFFSSITSTLVPCSLLITSSCNCLVILKICNTR